jgi:hypothetical protein
MRSPDTKETAGDVSYYVSMAPEWVLRRTVHGLACIPVELANKYPRRELVRVLAKIIPHLPLPVLVDVRDMCARHMRSPSKFEVIMSIVGSDVWKFMTLKAVARNSTTSFFFQKFAIAHLSKEENDGQRTFVAARKYHLHSRSAFVDVRGRP